jgi:hypothetical protein
VSNTSPDTTVALVGETLPVAYFHAGPWLRYPMRVFHPDCPKVSGDTGKLSGDVVHMGHGILSPCSRRLNPAIPASPYARGDARITFWHDGAGKLDLGA